MSDMEEDKDSLSRTLAFDRGHGYAQKDYDAMRDREEFGGGGHKSSTHSTQARTRIHARHQTIACDRQQRGGRTDGRTHTARFRASSSSSFRSSAVVLRVGGASTRTMKGHPRRRSGAR